MRRLLAVALSAALTFSSAPAFAASPAVGFRFKIETLPGVGTAGTRGAGREVVAERLLVRFDPAATAAQKAAVLSAVNGTAGRTVFGWTVVTLPSGASVVPALAVAGGMPGVLQASPDSIIHASAVPNDTLTNQQYALQQVNAFSAWEYETGASNVVTIAIIDTGIEGTHPDLSAKVGWTATSAIKHQNFVTSTTEAVPTDPNCGHGTAVASVAAASTNNSLDVAGMSWGAQLLSLKVFDAGCNSSDATVANAIGYVTTTVVPKLNTADPVGKRVIINMSLGQATACAGAGNMPNTYSALQTAADDNVPVAIAAGNNLPAACFSGLNSGVQTGLDAPANCAGNLGAGRLGIIPVTATDANNNVTSYSCTGPEVAQHGLAAPGDKVLVDMTGGTTGSDSGTSFAAPHVAGMIALMLSAKPALTNAQVESYLRGGADSIGGFSLATTGLTPAGNSSGAGRLDAFRTMRLTENGTLANFDGDQKAIAFPNPFRMSEQRSVSFSIPVSLQGSNPQIKIYTADGVLVRTLSGQTWDGKNDSGNEVGSGTYIFLVTTGAGKTKGRVAVIR